MNADVIVVGSGAGGAMSAWTLTRAGLKVLMLEAGRAYDPVAETLMFQWSREAPLRGEGTKDKPFGYYDATVDGGWEVPGEPYTTAPGTKFLWWRSRMVGGRTNHWARHVPRFGEYDFKGRTRDGKGVDWPISYAEISPWYDKTEAIVGVSDGDRAGENSPVSPDGVRQPAFKPRVPELLIQAACDDLGLRCVASPRAILTRPLDDRQACFNATPCGRGCSIGAAFQTPTSLIPLAEKTGRLRLVTDAMVEHVLVGADGKATGVRYVDRKTGRRVEAKARAVVLAASACETARILLNSRTNERPTGVANSSGQVGRNLTDTIGTGVSARFPVLEGRPRYNEDGNSMGHLYIPWNKYAEQARGELNFSRPYHLELSGDWAGQPDMGASMYGSLSKRWGTALKEDVARMWRSTMWIGGRGEMLPNENCFCEIDPQVKDRFGIPVLRFHWKWVDEDVAMVAHMRETMFQIVDRAGGEVLWGGRDQKPEDAIAAGGEIIHEVGTARMGDDAKSSVTDSYGRTWDVPNLVLADGSVFASNPHKNPTITIMALAMRGAEQLAARMKRGEA